MVDPSKDQFYQQQLAPWSHLGGASGYGGHHPLPATHQSHAGMYGASRLNHSFSGLMPAETSNAAPPPPSTTSTSQHPYYPMHLAALTAAAAVASDFSRPLPAPSPAHSGSAAPHNAPLPAHLTRHPYQNYHPHAYMPPSYYGNHNPPGGGSASREANGYNPPPSSYATLGSKDLSSNSAYNLTKSRDSAPPARTEDRNGYKPGGSTGGSDPTPPHYQPFPPYPAHSAAAPAHPSHSAYHYPPFDMSKIGYQFGHQQPWPAHPHSNPPPPAHPTQPSTAKSHSVPQQPPPTQSRHPSFDASRPSSLTLQQQHQQQQPPSQPPTTTTTSSADHSLPGVGQINGVSSHCGSSSSANSVPPKPDFYSNYLEQPATHPSIKQLLPQQPHPPNQQSMPTTPAPMSSHSSIGALSVPTYEPKKLETKSEASSKSQTPVYKPPAIGETSSLNLSSGNKLAQPDFKRRASFTNLASNEPAAKKMKVDSCGQDPYKFEEEDPIKPVPMTESGANGIGGGDSINKFGTSFKSEVSPVSSPGGSGSNSAYSGYKFKNALLSRNCGLDNLPKLSSKPVPLMFEVSQTQIFAEVCDRFMEDLSSKPLSVSKRASVESFKAAQEARAARKAEKKAEKEQQKAEAAERRAEREERKEKERLGLLPPKSQKKRGRKSKKESAQGQDDEQQEHDTSGEINESLLHPHSTVEEDLNDVSNVKENEPSEASTDENFAKAAPLVTNASNNNNPTSVIKDEKPKKGGTWALPIVPKMPQKPPGEKRKGLAPLPNIPMPSKSSSKSSEVRPKSSSKSNKSPSVSSAGNGSNAGGLTNVWLQAFGAKPAVTKTPKQEPVESKEKLRNEMKATKKTYLDIPPEKRRRPKPNFGGLIHFSPDWERAVHKYRQKARFPQSLIDGIKVRSTYILPFDSCWSR